MGNKIKQWLIDHDIKFVEAHGAISVDINLLMEEGIFDEFHKFCYELNKKNNG